MRFEKWQGLGNDFILVERQLSPDRARALCDRHRGIGADGVIAVEPAAEPALIRMVVLNADGSRPEMCGNGLRCAVGWVAERRGLQDGTLTVRTDAGERACWFTRQQPGCYQVRATMGAAHVIGDLDVPAAGGVHLMHVDVGNPHAVCFDFMDRSRRATLGPAIERSVEGGINVEFCRASPDDARIEVVVWERGVGFTQACGTGACAVAAAAASCGKLSYDAPIEVLLPGGPLEVTVASDGHGVQLRGPAERVFVGEFPDSAC